MTNSFKVFYSAKNELVPLIKKHTSFLHGLIGTWFVKIIPTNEF